VNGYTLVELLIALAITLVMTAATLSLVGPAHHVFQVQPEIADLQQRARVGIDALQHDLRMAGAGMYSAGLVGPLHHAVAPVMPYRAFGTGSDAARGVYFRPDAISLLFVASTASQTTLATPMRPSALDIAIENPATCPATAAGVLCGFAAGDQLLMFDRAGQWDVFTVDRVDGAATLVLAGIPATRGFEAGTNVTAARAVTYSLRSDSSSGAFQLVRAEGSDPAQPVLDHVVKLEFRYFVDPEPPRVIDEVAMPPRATYGPAPPSLDRPLAGWPAGENCTFALVDGRHQPRLAALGSVGTLVEISPALLTDGPWCPDASAGNRFDADLLRIRRVRFVIRVQTPIKELRGRAVPDLEMQLDVTPRNLNLEPETRNLEPGNPEPGT
jgi:prepilin-type N-terminal cleavage/methylation domain-containing protein